MIKAKVYDTYYPYRAKSDSVNGYSTEEGEGIEYNFDLTDEQVIDYGHDYYRVSFDTFWNTLDKRFNLYKTHIDKNAVLWFSKAEFQNVLLSVYKEQEMNKSTNIYYSYVQMNNSTFYNKMLLADNLTTEEESSRLNILAFLINQNQYIKEEIKTIINGDEEEIKTVYSIGTLTGTSSDPEQYQNSYKNANFYMGVSSFQNPTTNDEINTFYYYEFHFLQKRIQHKITKLQINAPIGTTFFLNRELYPISISRYQTFPQKDNLFGIYTLEPDDYMTLSCITFPKDTIPKYTKTINWNWKPGDPESDREISVDYTTLGISVSFLYDDDYDVPYEKD